MTLETYHILFRSSHFLKESSQSPQLLTAPDFRLQPPRLLFLVDEYPQNKSRQPPQRSKGPPAHAPPKARPPPVPAPSRPSSMPDPRSSPSNPLRKPKPIFYNPNRLNKKLGSFLHFALPRTR